MVAGRELSPQDAQATARLHRYWTAGAGLAKWRNHTHPWTALREHLMKYMTAELATRTATVWFHEVFGYYPGSDLHRVNSGRPPRGHRVGPG